MSFFDRFKKKNKQNVSKPLISTDWFTPFYSQYGNDIYKNIVVQQALNCIVREVKKLKPQHIIRKENRIISINDNIQRVLDNPNPLMTTTDFLEKITWQLYFNYNSFILPIYENGFLVYLYPIQPTQVDFLQDESEQIFIKFVFANANYESIVKYSDVIHIRYNFSISEFMGGNKVGQPDNDALLQAVDLNNSLLSGVSKALKSSFAINGIVKYNTLMDDGKTELAVKQLSERLVNGDSGLLPMDLKGEFVPFQRQIQMIDSNTLKFVDDQILRNFGVPSSFLTGDYTKAQYESFFQKTIEPLITSYSQAFNKCLFKNQREKHEILFNHKELEFMTTSEKIQWLTLASNVGAITINEMREIIGYPPYEDEALGNSPIMSKNYGDATVVKEEVINNE